jgi:hypothetical protein
MNIKSKYFYCYDLGLISYLSKQGFQYITKARHIKTNKVFAVFLKTKELNEYIEKWNKFIK